MAEIIGLINSLAIVFLALTLIYDWRLYKLLRGRIEVLESGKDTSRPYSMSNRYFNN